MTLARWEDKKYLLLIKIKLPFLQADYLKYYITCFLVWFGNFMRSRMIRINTTNYYHL